MSKKRKQLSDSTDKIEVAGEPAEEKPEEAAVKNTQQEESMDEGIRLDMSWIEKGKNEIGNCVFNNSPDTLKKGEPYDLLIIICALFAGACLSVMAVSGINKGFTPSMWVLMGCYAFIIFCCLCKPLHYAISKSAWNTSLKEKFPVNKGYSNTLELFPEKISVTDAFGRKEKVMLDDMAGIYETGHFLVFHENDSRIFAVSKEKLADNDFAGEIKEILEGRVKIIQASAETVKEAPASAEKTEPENKEQPKEKDAAESVAEADEEKEDVNAVRVHSVTSFADKKRKELEELESLMKEDK